MVATPGATHKWIESDSVGDIDDASDNTIDENEEGCGGGDGDAGGMSDIGDGHDSGEDLGRILRPTRTRVWTDVCPTFFGFRSCFKNGIDRVSKESFQKMEANLTQAARVAAVTDCPFRNSPKVPPDNLKMVNQCVAKMDSAVCDYTSTGGGTSDAPDLNDANDAVLLASFGLAVVMALLVIVGSKSDGQELTPPVIPCQGKHEAITEEKEDEIRAELAEDKVRSTQSYKTYCKEQADYVKNDLGIETPQSMQFADENYTVVKGAVPVYIPDLIEKYMKRRGFKKEAMFTKVVNDVVYHDLCRQMLNCAWDWVMYFLIAVPVAIALMKHGLLNMVGGGLRAAKVVTYILSPAKAGDATKRHQAFDEDFAHYLAGFFKTDFGISVLVGCVEGSIVHIIPKSYGGKDEKVERKIKAGEFLEVPLKRGEALVMGPGLVHRGTGYNVRNSRLFVAFMGGRSSVASFLNTYNVYNIVTGKADSKVSSS